MSDDADFEAKIERLNKALALTAALKELREAGKPSDLQGCLFTLKPLPALKS